MIHALVLAAGASVRMGEPKALLPVGGTTFAGHIIGVLEASGLSGITIVLGADAELIRRKLPPFQGHVVVNEQWAAGQLSSLVAGLRSIGEVTGGGALVWPVDCPFVSRLTVAPLLTAFRKHTAKIIVPVHLGRRGHPVIFPAKYFGELKNVPSDVGARQVLRDHPDSVLEVETPEEGILVNIDTPEAYRTHLAAFAALQRSISPAAR